ncbi:hypothetical protein BDN71DRAFT_1435953 [Pleurotus eryngii]|uniref:Uncharacterized protein n=1 Tax=Pleurotus eryngii TaxID=5323 RepID=A0A9P5ZII8_PLEER|nr:hypothetical protein BDN71DRAFT_1435953 [Pleurotus eryngii]
MSGRLAILIKIAYAPPYQVRVVARGDHFSQAEADDSWEPGQVLYDEASADRPAAESLNACPQGSGPDVRMERAFVYATSYDARNIFGVAAAFFLRNRYGILDNLQVRMLHECVGADVYGGYNTPQPCTLEVSDSRWISGVTRCGINIGGYSEARGFNIRERRKGDP